MAADGAAAGTSAYTSSIVKGSAGIGSGTVKQEDGCQRSGTPSPTTGELTLPSEPSSRAGDSSATPAMTATTVQQGERPVAPPYKQCRKCGRTKPAAAFQMDRHNVDGLQSYCRSCKAERARERRTEKDAAAGMAGGSAGGTATLGSSRRSTKAGSRAEATMPDGAQTPSPVCSPPWGHLTLKQQAPSPQPAAEPEAAQKPASSQRAVGGAAAAAVAPPPPGQKRCSRCRVAKPRGDFHRNRTTADGLQYQCKSCHAEAVAAPKVAAAAAAAHDEAAGSENPWSSAKERRLHRRKVQPARRPVAKHGRAADAGSDEGGGSRKEKSRRLSDIGTDLAPLFRNDSGGRRQDAFALLQQAAEQAAQREPTGAEQLQEPTQGPPPPAATQQRPGVSVSHKLCTKCQTVKSAAEFWKNKSTVDGLQWFCRQCQTRVCNNLKDAARSRNAARRAAEDANPPSAAQATGAPQPAAAPKRTPKRKPAAAALHSAGSWRGGEAEQEPPQFSPGLDALAAAGARTRMMQDYEAAAAEVAVPRRRRTGGADPNAGTAAAAPSMTLQEALKLPAVPGEGGGPGVGGMRLADGAAALARLEVAAVAQSPLMGAAAADGAAAEDAAAAAASIDTTASHTTADAAPQDEAVMSRAGGVMETVAGGGGGPSGGRAAAGNALGDVQLPSGADVALLAGAVAVAAGGKSLETIIEACRMEAAAAAERRRLTRELLSAAPHLAPSALRVRSVYSSGAASAAASAVAAAAAGAGSGYRVVGNGTRAAAVKHEPQTAFGTPPQRRIYDATALLGGASSRATQTDAMAWRRLPWKEEASPGGAAAGAAVAAAAGAAAEGGASAASAHGASAEPTPAYEGVRHAAPAGRQLATPPVMLFGANLSKGHQWLQW